MHACILRPSNLSLTHIHIAILDNWLKQSIQKWHSAISDGFVAKCRSLVSTFQQYITGKVIARAPRTGTGSSKLPGVSPFIGA